MAAWLVGVVLVALVVVEVFNDLFHPTGTGALSEWLGRRIFNLFRRWPRFLPIAGPLALIWTIGLWVVLLGLGFGLVYYAAFPDGFRTSLGQVPAEPSRLSGALYFSFQVLTTLAFGDLAANSVAMRAVACVEGFIGFGVLTASVSSIVLIYPALARMRLLARGVAHLVASEEATGISLADSESDAMPAHLARDVTNTRIDLIHFPIIYFFAAHEPRASLAFAAPHLVRFAHQGQTVDRPAHMRLASVALERALDDLARAIGDQFLDMKGKERDAVFRAFAADHRVGQSHEA